MEDTLWAADQQTREKFSIRCFLTLSLTQNPTSNSEVCAAGSLDHEVSILTFHATIHLRLVMKTSLWVESSVVIEWIGYSQYQSSQKGVNPGTGKDVW